MLNVGLVIVSHSSKVAEGTADMVRQMVGTNVPVAWTGGTAEGKLGTDVALIKAAIDRVWSEAGVAVFVDLGGAEMNSEMAVLLLEESKQSLVALCVAPVVEGAVLAAAESAGGSNLKTVKRVAEELMSA